MNFNHEKLEVYQVSIELLSFVFDLIQRMPQGYGFLLDQLKRASLSIPLNIAEGNAKFSKKEKAKFFLIARASANECSAIFDVALTIKVIEKEACYNAKSLLYRIVCMLSKLIT
jgi:four helix bundle protein